MLSHRAVLQEPVECIDQKAGLATAMNNQKLYGELLRRFLENQSDFYELFRVLYEKQEIHLALHCVHSLKGLSGNIGAKALEKAAAKLEYALQNQSEREIVAPLLEKTHEALKLVLAGIQHIKDNFLQRPLLHATIDEREVQRLWKRLEEELKNYDANASDTMEELLQQFSSHPQHEDVTLLSRAIVNYQFEEALEHLHRINTSKIKY